ncbi:hypothetical protein HZH68_005444 [Vespula germanica]|uniref:Uncharacterized protein n=1 Tax=Vespula germanica TaxID=30212 RepID=A0A834KG69_VESGE|nr:hypothetical protein HZH68_005444 [Vespula germanica]
MSPLEVLLAGSIRSDVNRETEKKKKTKKKKKKKKKSRGGEREEVKEEKEEEEGAVSSPKRMEWRQTAWMRFEFSAE